MKLNVLKRVKIFTCASRYSDTRESLLVLESA